MSAIPLHLSKTVRATMCSSIRFAGSDGTKERGSEGLNGQPCSWLEVVFVGFAMTRRIARLKSRPVVG